jgi:hypothetical protein
VLDVTRKRGVRGRRCVLMMICACSFVCINSTIECNSFKEASTIWHITRIVAAPSAVRSTLRALRCLTAAVCRLTLPLSPYLKSVAQQRPHGICGCYREKRECSGVFCLQRHAQMMAHTHTHTRARGETESRGGNKKRLENGEGECVSVSQERKSFGGLCWYVCVAQKIWRVKY